MFKKCLFSILLIFISFSCSFDTKEDITITSAKFSEEVVEIMVGEEKQVLFDIKPKAAIRDVTVTYTVTSPSKVIEISDETSNGCVIKGIKSGNCVLVAKCNGLTSYLQVNVKGSIDVSPYIVTPFVTLEMKKDSRKSVSVSLYGGSVNDNALFSFTSSNPEVVGIEESNNTVILTSLNSGFSRITINHPKADMETSIMVYVTEEEKPPIYITTSQNVMQLSLLDTTKTFSVSLIGSDTNDNSSFSYEVIKGKECIDVIRNNNYFSVTPLAEGNSVIEISHKESAEKLQILVVVVKTTLDTYIESDNNFLVLRPNELCKVNCFVVGSDDSSSNYKFSYTVDNPDVLNVTQVNNSFVIKAQKEGKGKVLVTNKLCKETHELLVIVEDASSSIENHYITTSQNIIKTEIGKDVTLSILLTNGTVSDKNGFSWTVDDSSIIDVTSSYGEVSYARSISSSSFDNLSVTALITPKKVGTANIKVTHPKSSTSVNVIVKVFPKGTLTSTKEFIGPSLVTLELGQKPYLYTLDVKNGPLIDPLVTWTIEDNSIVNVKGESLTSLMTPLKSGITYVKAKSSEVVHPHNITVVTGTKEELQNMNALYTKNNYPKVFVGETSYIEIMSKNPLNKDGFNVSINDTDVARVSVIDGVLIINALKAGSSVITVTHKDIEQSLSLILSVEDKISIDKPYYFSYERFQSLLIGSEKDIKVSLVGSSISDLSDITWELDSSSSQDVITFIPNKEVCRIKALKEGVVTLIVKSPKANLDARITIYTAENIEELNKKVVLTTDKENYLSTIGKSILLKVDVNNPNINTKKIKWSVNDISLCSISSSLDTCLVTLKKSGNLVVTASCENATLRFFISIKEKEEELYQKSITLPLILELKEGENKTLNVISNNLSIKEKEELKWEVSDDSVISITSNMDTSYIKALKSGYCRITVSNERLGLIASSEVIVSEDSKDNSIVMALPSSFYSINKGQDVILNLTFGKNKPSLEVLNSIIWESEDESVIDIYKTKDGASIRGKEEGVTTVSIRSPFIVNTLSIRCVVKDNKGFFFLSVPKIVNMITGTQKEIEIKLFNSENKRVDLKFSALNVKNDNINAIDVQKTSNSLVISALKSGEYVINLAYPNCSSLCSVLINVKDTEEELNNSYPLTTSKDHYLLNIGECVTLSVITKDDTSSINSFRWSCSNTDVCSYEGGGTKLTVKARKEGNTTFTCTHKESGNKVSFNVYVSSFKGEMSNVHILTDSIIPLVVGEEKETVINTSLKDEYLSSLVWSSNSSNLVVKGMGKKAIISSSVPGIYELTVKLNSYIYRTMIVYVKENEEELSKTYIHNIDKRYFVLKEGESVSIKPLFSEAYSSFNNTSYTPLYDNNTVSYTVKDGVLTVKGENEGITAFSVKDNESSVCYKIFFEVNKRKESVSDTPTGYLTTTKTVFFLDIKDQLKPISINVSAVDIEQKNYPSILFSLDNPSIATVIKNGDDGCFVYPNKKGETVLRVSSVYSSNVLEIRIVVGEREGEVYPYIVPSVDTLEMKEGEEKEIRVKFNNFIKLDKTLLKPSLKNKDTCSVTVTGDVVTVKALKSGQDVLTLHYEDESLNVSDVNIVISIKGDPSSFIYLTTQNNYSVIKQDSYALLSCSLVGMDDIDSSNYIWEIVEGSSVVSLVPNGKQCICNALESGNASIKVTHKNASYPLYMNVRVCEKEKESPIYITTTDNLINTTIGENKNISVELVNGEKSEYSLFTFENLNDDIINVQSAMNSAVITPLKSGTARIRVSHPSSVSSSLDIIVIVSEKEKEDEPYITTDEKIIEMSPTDLYKEINVSLVGGKPYEDSLFDYSILSFTSTIKNKDGSSNEVIEVMGSGEQAIIKPKNEGSAVVRVTNSATSHFLDIKVIVSLYNSLTFQTNSLNIVEGETSFIDVHAPTGKTVIYESSNENIVRASGTNKKCLIEALAVEEGKNSSVAVIKAHTSDGSSSDEIIVKVSKRKDSAINYISTSLNVLSLNTLTDAKGFTVSASLTGSDIVKSDEEEIKWTISSLDIINFASASSLSSVSGKEVLIKPVSSGETTIILSHPKCKNSKVIYVSVSQNEASLILSESYVDLPLDSIHSLSATLKGVSDKENENIVWKSSDREVCNIITQDSSGIGRGNVCNIKSNKVGEAVISCTFGNVVKYVSVFVKEEPSISLPLVQATLGLSTKDVMYKVDVHPSYLYDQVQIESSSATHAIVEKVLDHEKKECYIKVSTTNVSGSTVITAKVKNLVSKMKVITSGEVYMKLYSYSVYDQSGQIVETIMNPTSIHTDLSSSKVRVYYITEPSNVSFDNKEGNYSMYDLEESKFSSSSKDFINLSFGKDTEGGNGVTPYYFDIVPYSTGYASLHLVSSEHKGVNLDIPLSITDKAFTPNLISKSDNSYSRIDLTNGILNIANRDTITFTLDSLNLSSNAYRIEVKTNLNNEKDVSYSILNNCIKLTGKGSSSVASGILRSTNYVGTITIKIIYPVFNNVSETKSYTLLINQEVWN